MRKTDKKIERTLVESLTEVCEAARERVPGFAWITHFANFSSFPKSLRVVIVFSTDEQVRAARLMHLDEWLEVQVTQKLQAMGIVLERPRSQLRLDSEEACQRDHHGNWQERYRH